MYAKLLWTSYIITFPVNRLSILLHDVILFPDVSSYDELFIVLTWSYVFSCAVVNPLRISDTCLSFSGNSFSQYRYPPRNMACQGQRLVLDDRLSYFIPE